jgi:hypothetical protein
VELGSHHIVSPGFCGGLVCFAPSREGLMLQLQCMSHAYSVPLLDGPVLALQSSSFPRGLLRFFLELLSYLRLKAFFKVFPSVSHAWCVRGFTVVLPRVYYLSCSLLTASHVLVDTRSPFPDGRPPAGGEVRRDCHVGVATRAC